MHTDTEISESKSLSVAIPAEIVSPEYLDRDLLDAIPKDIGWMLLILGIIGLAIPGMVDIPLLLAGCIILWPSSYRYFQGLARTKGQERLLEAPVRFLTRFHADFEKRNPGGRLSQRRLSHDIKDLNAEKPAS